MIDFKFGEHISFQDKLFLTKHLATMIKAGIPLAEALETLADQNKSGALKKILENTTKKIKNGKSLANSLKDYPHIFNDFYVSLIAVGEESGTLEESLVFLAEQLSKDYALRQKIRSAMMYPALVFFATTIMGGFIAIYVLPKLVGFFDAFEFELPLSTKILLFVANFMKNWGLIFVMAMILSFMTFGAIVNLKFIKPYWHKFLLKVPLFGKMLQYNQLARFSRNLGVLMQSGLPVQRSLEITAGTLSNLVFSSHVKSLGEVMSKGQNIHEILKEKKYAEFPPLVYKMIGVGEKTGNLDTTLVYLGDFYEEEIDNLSKNLSTLLEPILLLAIGLVVGFVALAIISPIYELTGSIRR